ncbi:MAG TPA: type II and III secretion system protein family protein [Acidisarcina sp.]
MKTFNELKRSRVASRGAWLGGSIRLSLIIVAVAAGSAVTSSAGASSAAAKPDSALLASAPGASAQAASPVPPVQASDGALIATASVAPLSHAASAGELLPIVVGHSIFLDTTVRLKRVYVSNPLVLDSYTANPKQIVVTAKAAGTSSLVLWDEDGRSQAYLIVASLDMAGLRIALRRAFPLDNVDVVADEDNLSLSGSAGDQTVIDAAAKMAGVYSKNVVNAIVLTPPHPAQVKLKVRIVEIDRSKLDEFGLNFFGGPKNPSGVTTGQFPVTTSVTGNSGSSGTPGSTTLSISDPLNLFLFNNSLSVGVTIQALESRQIVQILAEPTITTVSGQKASFLSGGEFPFPVIQGGGTGSSVSVTIQFRPYGVKLDFTPFVNPDGTILLKVAPEVSALDYTNAVAISGYTIPALSTRRADTEVELRDGQSFAISGLLDRRTTDIMNQVPVAGNLPILGALFRSKKITHSVVELVVIVTPAIVDPLHSEPSGDQMEQPKFVVPVLDKDQFDKKFPSAVKAYPPPPS